MGQHFTYPELEGLWIRAGGRRRMAPEMAAIGEVESSGDSEPTPGKLGNNPGTASGLPGAVGLMQMEWPLYKGLGGVQTPQQALDPLTNMRMAVKLSRNDPSTDPGHPVYDNWIKWETPAGAYLSFLDPSARPSFGKGVSGSIGPVSPGPTLHIGPFGIGLPNPLGGLLNNLQGIVIGGAVVLAAVGLGVWGIARTAGSAREPA
jgi:hypothetical protein